MKKHIFVMYVMCGVLIQCTHVICASAHGDSVEMQLIQVNSGNEQQEEQEQDRKDELRVTSCCTWQRLGKPCCKAFVAIIIFTAGIYGAIYGYEKFVASATNSSNPTTIVPVNATGVHAAIEKYRKGRIPSYAVQHTVNTTVQQPIGQPKRQQIYQPKARTTKANLKKSK